MNQHLERVVNLIKQDASLSEEEKSNILKSLKAADKDIEIVLFKLDRTEKVKRTTTILLEETIGELDQKRVAIEVQNRNLEVESSLERVRTAAMTMNRPDDMLDICRIISQELEMLGTREIRNVQTAIFHPDKGTYINYEYYRLHDKSLITELDYLDNAMTSNFAHRMQRDAGEFFTESLTGDELKEWFEYQRKTPQFFDSHLEKASSLNYYWFSLGPIALGISTYSPLNEKEIDLFKRFRNVFELSYRRFLDVEQAMEQAKEAKIEVALEKVRSRTLAMQKSDELSETAAVVFRQLILLGIAPNRLYIGIIRDHDALMEFWVTDEDGSKVSKQFIGDANRNGSMHKMYEGWKSQAKTLTVDMQGEELRLYFDYLANELKVPFKQGLEQRRRIQSIAFFARGFIGIASPDPQPEATMVLLERFAAVFNLTYTRFNDLKLSEAHALQAEEDLVKLQTEKKRAEDALEELRQTQKQLVQSEKMASLGELTAGIAHEIQNPLNFVNNFSEVSKELLDEMKEALDKGDAEDAKAIADDVIQNLEKINHHGKRADGIVKGMLQHSRSNSGQKELTDINALCDEYLRLAYHGLRAKDKTFNAKFRTEFDSSIGKINVVPQDTGRVILNLINNALYAVNEKAKLHIKEYDPMVAITTSKTEEGVEIRVSDNGKGIPKSIGEKIFQPFFTTKPTGQGTGLGLSLAYDIITKGHGGKMSMETKEGVGATFIIHLPLL